MQHRLLFGMKIIKILDQILDVIFAIKNYHTNKLDEFVLEKNLERVRINAKELR
uniref:Uncharacterized protein n=1 Tax=Myoviridae sp. ctCo31 TaxID=2825053 RepID=A0A8S5UMA5_9CAUD|nr:MAG TPA: hypothetical protein [Myoviridae sp. ctCo31]